MLFAVLSEQMYKDGLTNIENIDVSKVVLSMMEEKTKDLTGMTCILLFGSFHIILSYIMFYIVLYCFILFYIVLYCFIF